MTWFWALNPYYSHVLKIIMCSENKDTSPHFFLCVSLCVVLEHLYVCSHVCGYMCVFLSSEAPGFLQSFSVVPPGFYWGGVSKSKQELTDLGNLASQLPPGIPVWSPLPSLALQTGCCARPCLHPYLHELCGWNLECLSGRCLSCSAVSLGPIRMLLSSISFLIHLSLFQPLSLLFILCICLFLSFLLRYLGPYKCLTDTLRMDILALPSCGRGREVLRFYH